MGHTSLVTIVFGINNWMGGACYMLVHSKDGYRLGDVSVHVNIILKQIME
jgi:hypothetical protein